MEAADWLVATEDERCAAVEGCDASKDDSYWEPIP